MNIHGNNICLISSEEATQAKVREGSLGGRSETTGEGFVQQVGVGPGVKERGSYE